MLSFVFQKIRNKKWMFISLLLGNLMMIAIAAVGPMYSQAALQNMLTKDLSAYLVEKDTNPGNLSIRSSYSKAGGNDKTFQRVEERGKQFAEMIRELDIPVIYDVEHLYVLNVKAVHDVQVEGAHSPSLRLDSYSDVEEHITIVNGEMYSKELDGNVIEVVVNENTFVEMSLMLGEELQLTGLKNDAGEEYKIRIVGIFQNSQEQDAYWISSPNAWSSVCLMDQELFKSLFLRKDRDSNAEWYTVVDYTQMRGEDAEHYSAVLEKYHDIFEELKVNYKSFAFESVVEEFIPKAAKVNTTIWVLLLPIFALLAAFIFMVSRQMLEMEQNEISIYKSRGANKGQIIMIYLVQSICISVVSLIGGIPLGYLMCKILGASNAFLEFVKRTALPLEIGPNTLMVTGIAALFSICTMVLPVFKFANVNIVDHKRQKNRKRKHALWELLCVDIILLGVAVYGLYQYNNQKEYLAQQMMDGASLDPLLYICSSLFMVGAGLLILRLFPLAVRFVFWAGKRWWAPSMYTSFLRIIRTKTNQGFLMVFLILTVAMGIYNAQAARTINANAEEKIQYTIGADVVLQELWIGGPEADEPLTDELIVSTDAADEPDFSKYYDMDGIESVTKVFVDANGKARTTGGMVSDVQVMGIHTKEFGETAWFKESLLPLHYHEYLNAMSQDAKAILVSSNFQELYGYKVGDVLNYSNAAGDYTRGVIYGFVDYWPSYAPVVRTKGTDGLYKEKDNFLIVAHLGQLQSTWGVTPYQVWIETEDSTQFIYEYTAESGTIYTVFEDTSAQLIALKNDPVFQSTNGILTIGFICILLLCTMGFLIYWILSIQSRTLQFGIFRAMGMSMREVFTMLLNEQFWITGISLAAGVVVGIVTSKLFVPLIQMAYSSADQVLPMEIISESSDYVRLFVVIGAVILLCMGILGGLISKIKISQALKLGED